MQAQACKLTKCSNSLKRLGIDTIDLYYLHRVDPNMPIEDTVRVILQFHHKIIINSLL